MRVSDAFKYIGILISIETFTKAGHAQKKSSKYTTDYNQDHPVFYHINVAVNWAWQIRSDTGEVGRFRLVYYYCCYYVLLEWNAFRVLFGRI